MTYEIAIACRQRVTDGRADGQTESIIANYSPLHCHSKQLSYADAL